VRVSLQQLHGEPLQRLLDNGYLLVAIIGLPRRNEVLMRSSSATNPYHITCISFAGIIAGVRIKPTK